MDFREAVRKMADYPSGWSEDLGMNSHLPERNRVQSQPDPSTDEQDPATSGGPSPFNGVAPFGEPVASDPLWLDPQDEEDHRGKHTPYRKGPDENVTTLHARRERPGSTEKDDR